ncbi:MAG: radical SAM protein, partial [Muribaculaceae bacterium]|nr:radical SAM protein [Muribaculaceae bacterium]
DLIREIDRVDGIARYRISSIEPNLLSDEIIDFVAASRAFMPHFHIPLQSGSDTVLQLMRRHYDTAHFKGRIDRIRSIMPDAFIGVDLITGARGETRDEFERSRDFIASLDVTKLHIFPYSERPGTRALGIEHVVSQEEKHQRAKEMAEISDAKLDAFTRRFASTQRPVLLEHSIKGKPMSGFTDNYLKVYIEPSQPQLDNHIVNVNLLSPIAGGEMKGEIAL